MRTFGEPARLEAASRHMAVAVRQPRPDVAAYHRAIHRVPAEPSDLDVAIDDRSRLVTDHLAELEVVGRTPAAVAAALRLIDTFVPDTPHDRRWLATSDRATLDAMVAFALEHDTVDASLLWSATPAATAGREELLARLDGGWLGVTTSDLEAIEELLADASPAIADGILAGLTDDQLATLVGATAPDPRPWVGWPRDRRHGLWTTIGSRVRPGTFARIVPLTDDLDPPPLTARGDVASDDVTREDWFVALEYEELDGWFTWRGADDPHRIDRSDVTQGRIGNCYLIASMIGIADRAPHLLEEMMTENANGTVTVRFADGTAVTVTRTVPVHPDRPGQPAFASRALDAGNRDVPGDGYEQWPLLLEKAVAQRHGSWGEIVGGWPGASIQELVGGEHRAMDTVELDLIRDHLDAGDVVTFATLPDGRVGSDGEALYAGSRTLAGQHAYVVEGIDARDRLVLVNPWNPLSPPDRLSLEEAEAVGWKVEINVLP